MQGFRLILAYFPASLTLFLWLYSFLYKGFSLFWQALVVCQAKDCEFEGKWRGYSLPQQIS